MGPAGAGALAAKVGGLRALSHQLGPSRPIKQLPPPPRCFPTAAARRRRPSLGPGRSPAALCRKRERDSRGLQRSRRGHFQTLNKRAGPGKHRPAIRPGSVGRRPAGRFGWRPQSSGGGEGRKAPISNVPRLVALNQPLGGRRPGSLTRVQRPFPALKLCGELRRTAQASSRLPEALLREGSFSGAPAAMLELVQRGSVAERSGPGSPALSRNPAPVPPDVSTSSVYFQRSWPYGLRMRPLGTRRL